jgi:hypothetical protein
MEFKNTLEIVTKDIQDIEKLVSNFKNYSRIPNIELDLALSRLRNVYDLLLLFRNESNILPEIAAAETPQKESIPPPEIHIKTVPPAVVPEKPVDIVPPVAVPGVTTHITDPQYARDPFMDSEIKSKHFTKESPKPGNKKNPEEQKIFIHEKLGEQSHKKDISSRLQNQPIKSISGSLGINDKFFFIRELFAGNADLFRETLAELDNARNFNEAYSQLMSKFQWDMESEPVQMLLNLVRRKFITSGNE